ncbi:uncharacterized protein F4807DRAFT_319572 [Annulohypoxylon truncatum]|uniref:uncharacterized protein n=1 Tax=Annulohypoxylon truncatum TaxID=327061 RepID=UPI002008BD56|nr:uncharacterized protein F4807DRAFT_319572 [Annulohypoxylon truncatum]KAI1204830.1 hypothetical protein F4807DRAFT_319572 [Annulohypoxylon truncatum]
MLTNAFISISAPIPPNSLAPRVENRVKPEEWWYTENGRSYDTFRRGKYMFPMDEVWN